MKGDPEILKVLQEVLSAELTAINQYFIHARMLRNWRYMRLADHTEKESIGEMKHAQEVMDRILYFDASPNMQKYMKINVGRTVPEMMKVDLDLELDAVKRLNAGIHLATQKGDNGSRGPSSRRSCSPRRSTSTTSRRRSSRSRTSAPRTTWRSRSRAARRALRGRPRRAPPPSSGSRFR